MQTSEVATGKAKDAEIFSVDSMAELPEAPIAVQEDLHKNNVVDAIHELTDVVKKSLEEPKVNLHVELVNKKETNIDKNYGPNIEHNGGTLELPDKMKE